GGTTSLYSPWNPYTWPSESRWMNRQVPPGRTSIFSTVVVYLFGPHHRGISFGSVHAFQTSARGASKMYVVTSSRSDVLAGSLCAARRVHRPSRPRRPIAQQWPAEWDGPRPRRSRPGRPMPWFG